MAAYSFRVFIRNLIASPPPASSPSERKTAIAANVFSRASGATSGGAGSRVCMTDSGAIESDLERFQKTFSRSPTYKASLSPRERRVARDMKPRTTRLRRGVYIHTHNRIREKYTHIRTIATRGGDEGGGMTERERERKREAEGERRRGRRSIEQKVDGDEGETKRKENTTICVYIHTYECVDAYICAGEGLCVCVCGVRARAGTTESTERNTEKTLVKGKRPLCLPFQSNRPPLSPLSFSLCPRFGSSRSLPAKPPS